MTPAGRHSRVGLPGAQRSRAIWGCTMSKRIGMVAGEPSGDLLAVASSPAQAGDFAGRCRPGRDATSIWHPMHALTVRLRRRASGAWSTYRDERRWLSRRPCSLASTRLISTCAWSISCARPARPRCTSSVRRSGRGAMSASTRSASRFRTCWYCFRSRKRSTARKAYRSPTSAIRWPARCRCRTGPPRACGWASTRTPACWRSCRAAARRKFACWRHASCRPRRSCKARSGVAVHRAHGQRTAARGVPVLPRAVPGAGPALRHGAGPAWRRRRTAAPVAWSVMEASTAVLVASGTATLETRGQASHGHLLRAVAVDAAHHGLEIRPGTPLSALGRTAQRAAARLRGAGAAQDDATPESWPRRPGRP